MWFPYENKQRRCSSYLISVILISKILPRLVNSLQEKKESCVWAKTKPRYLTIKLLSWHTFCALACDLHNYVKGWIQPQINAISKMLKVSVSCRKRFPTGTREYNFQSSEILWKHGQNFIISFISPKLSRVSHEVKHSFSTFGVARNELFWEDI